MSSHPQPVPESAPAAAGTTYAAAGVDTAAGDRAVELMRASVAATMTPAVVGEVGGFAGLVDVSALRDYRRPLLATSTDGVGTKVAIAQALGVHDTIGQDLVGMVVDDIVVVGARPLLMTDYIACGRVVPERVADVVRGVATACAAVIPGTIRTGTSRHCGSSATSSTAAAMANTPGSPEDTTATRRPRLAISNAMAARSASTLLSERCLRCPARSATRLT